MVLLQIERNRIITVFNSLIKFTYTEKYPCKVNFFQSDSLCWFHCCDDCTVQPHQNLHDSYNYFD